MHPFLVCLSVAILSECLKCFATDEISDLSDDCFKGRTIATYLTSGMGVSDMFVAIVAKEGVNCTMNFLVHKENYIIVVIEFLDWFLGKPQCGSTDNEVNVMVRGGEVINICHKVESNIFRTIGKHVLSVSVKGPYDLQTVKVTATSVQVSRYGKCTESEIKCIYEDEVYCMSERTRCDGNVNCGVRHKYDESPSYCQNYNTVNPAMIIVGLAIVFVTFCMMVALLKKLVPNREGTFIVKEDETLSEKDRATSEKDFKVKIRILYDTPDMKSLDLDAEVSQEQTTHRRTSVRKIKPGQKS